MQMVNNVKNTWDSRIENFVFEMVNFSAYELALDVKPFEKDMKKSVMNKF